MLPTFFGLNTVTRALLAQQEAVDVVNQNIANASTPGYSRQQAILTATDPYTSVAFDRPSLPGQLGTGATVSKIKRFQDELLNTQIRAQNQTTGQYEAMDDLYTQVQAIYNDPSTLAVNQASTNFFNAVHDLSNNPESVPAREALQQQGQTLSAAIGTDYQQLTTLQGDLNTKVGTIVADVNTTIQQIASLNTQIAQVTGIGDNPNDLMDQRDQLVNHLSTLVDTHDVKNPDGTDTIQLNGRFLVNKDQAYTLTTLTDAASPAYVKPVQVFWQEDVTKFQNIHPGYDPITGVNLTTGASLSSTAQPPLSVKQADVTTGSLYGAMAMRDQVIQDTLLPQLNALADGLTNTQVLSPKGGLDPNASQAGLGGTGSFTVTVLTPQGQTVTYNPSIPSGSAPTTVQGVIDAINGSVVAPYVHASLSAAGQLEIDTTQTGTLVKVDQADAVASRLFGFSQSVADGFNAVHVQGFGLDTPPQWTGGISGLTLSTPIGTGDGLTITGPDGVPVNVVVQPPLIDPKVVATASITGATVAAQPSSPQNLAVAINGATSSGTVTIVGTDSNGNALTEALSFNGNGTLTTQNQFATVTSVTGSGGFNVAATTVSVTALSTPNTVQDLVNAINSVNQTDTQAIGSVTGLTPLTSMAGTADFTITVVRPDGVKVTFDPANTTPTVSTMQDVLDAINGTGSYLSNTVSGYVRASINPQGQLEIDSTTPGALVKVDQATTATNTALGFQTGTLPDPVGQEHGFQASLDSQGRLIISSQPTVYDASGQLQSISAQLVGTKGVTSSTALATGSMTVVGPNGQLQLTLGTGGSTDTVANLIATINAANIGVTASINSAGQFQLTTPEIGANATITLTATSGDANSKLGLRDSSSVGQRRGYPPSASLSAQALTTTFSSVAAGSTDAIGTPNAAITTHNQFFFQGAQQVLANQLLAPTAIGSAAADFPASLVSPGRVAFTLVGASTFGTLVVKGLDANGNALSDTLTFGADGTQTTSDYFKTVTSIAPSGMTTGTLQAVGLIPSTEADTAGALAVDGNILKDPSLIAASSTADAPGNQTNALALLNVQQNTIMSDGQQAVTFGDFYGAAITNLGDQAQQVHTTSLTQQQLVQHLTNQQQSVVGVSIDQEASDLVALQHAYEAAARAITTQDDMLNTIITGMGLVGR